MTIVVGIITSNGSIVFASDSQNTSGAHKTLNAKKIHALEFEDADAIVAESGSSDLSGRAIEILQDRARGKMINNQRTVADFAQDAIREIRQVMLGGYSPGQISAEDFQRYLANNWGFSLTMGCLWQEKPQLFCIDNISMVARQVNSHFTAAGCGAELANYLLGEYLPNETDHWTSLAMAIYVVEKVKQSVNGCSGPTQVSQLAKIVGCFDSMPRKVPIRVLSLENPELIPSSHGRALLPVGWATATNGRCSTTEPQRSYNKLWPRRSLNRLAFPIERKHNCSLSAFGKRMPFHKKAFRLRFVSCGATRRAVEVLWLLKN